MQKTLFALAALAATALLFALAWGVAAMLTDAVASGALHAPKDVAILVLAAVLVVSSLLRWRRRRRRRDAP
jgi:membrane protein implicated in regulation of membrane protease activity